MKLEKIFFTRNSISIKESILKLKDTGTKCLIIVDVKNKLLGTLTDGDLREVIVKKIDLNKSIKNFYNKNPKSIKRSEYTIELAKKFFQNYRIDTIPIIENKKVVDVVTWADVFLKKKSLKETSVVIMAGGKGERLKPFTNVLPKPLVPIHDKTIIELIIENFSFHGVEKFNFTLNYKGNLIKTYLNHIKKKKKFKYVNEKTPLGTIGSLSLINENNISKNFFVTNCDIIIKSDLKKIYDHHMQKKNDITIVVCYQKYKIPYGTCIVNKQGKLKSLVEKPETNHLINTGFYLMNKKILKFVPKNKNIDFNDFIKNILKKRLTIGVYPVDLNSWVDVGTWSEYKKNIDYI